jgi:protein RecA
MEYMMDLIEQIYKGIGENDSNQDVSDWLTTGYLPLNEAISGTPENGFPVGRITEIFGGESSGKTLLATMAMIETQKKGGIAVFLDYEHAFSLKRAETLGLRDDEGTWVYKQPDTAEQGFKIIDFIANKVREADSDKHVTVVVDSVASMMTEDEMKADYDQSNMKTKLSLPALLSPSLKKLAKLINDTNVTLIFLNQVRDNPGVMFGDKEKTSGGRALKFYCSVRIKLTKSGKIKDGDRIIGENVKAQIVKNKVSEPWRTAQYTSSFTEGINLYVSHIDALIEDEKIEKSGAYLVWGEKKYHRSKLEALMREDAEEYQKLLSMFGGQDVAA